uniref:Uncharacterized protein n=1 Tax=Varanus komodoensis TaxID=61221 RepID=A0A8D2LLY0_VARKO
MLIICGGLVNGPYALITTAVSADLGTHESLQRNAKALSTVTAIIDGTGSVGEWPESSGQGSQHSWVSTLTSTTNILFRLGFYKWKTLIPY